MSAATQENAGRASRQRLHQAKLAPGDTTSSSRTNFFRDLSNSDVIKQPKHDQKSKDEDVDSSYCVNHDMPECDPEHGSAFASKFVASSSFNNLVACIKSTKLCQRRYKMRSCSRPQSDIRTVEQRLEPITQDYSNPGPLKNLPEIPDWEDLDIPDLNDL